jgi:diketogulonate reductase-like aldo/keto reductase
VWDHFIAQYKAIAYRHIDTARYYRNEADVGKAVRSSGIPRDEIFITTKIFMPDFGYENAQQVGSDEMMMSTSLEICGCIRNGRAFGCRPYRKACK